MAKYSKLPQADIESTAFDYSSNTDFTSVFTYEYPKYFSHGGHSNKFRSAFTYPGECDPNFKRETLDSVKPHMVFNICAGIITVLCYTLVILTLPISWFFCFKTIQHYERLVVFRLGRLLSTKGPGVVVVLPCIDRHKRVDLRLKAFSVPPQSIMTVDGGGVELGAEIYHHIKDPVLCVNNVQDLNHSLRIMSQTTIQSILPKYEVSEIDTSKALISEKLVNEMNKMALSWGVEITKVELSAMKLLVEPNQGKQTNPMDILGQMLLPPGSSTAGVHPMQQLASNFLSGMSNATLVKPATANHTVVNMDLMGVLGDSTLSMATANKPKKFQNAYDLLEAVQPILNQNLVADFQTVYKFIVSGENGGTFYLDLKNGHGSVGLGEPPLGDTDVIMKLSSDNLKSLLNEETSPIAAYMTGSLEVEGDTQSARQLSQLIELINI